MFLFEERREILKFFNENLMNFENININVFILTLFYYKILVKINDDL